MATIVLVGLFILGLVPAYRLLDVFILSFLAAVVILATVILEKKGRWSNPAGAIIELVFVATWAWPLIVENKKYPEINRGNYLWFVLSLFSIIAVTQIITAVIHRKKEPKEIFRPCFFYGFAIGSAICLGLCLWLVLSRGIWVSYDQVVRCCIMIVFSLIFSICFGTLVKWVVRGIIVFSHLNWYAFSKDIPDVAVNEISKGAGSE